MSVLIIDLDDIKSGSCRAQGDVTPGELEIDPESLFEFDGPLHLDARISSTDQLSFYVTGKLAYSANGECRRCLKAIRQEVNSVLRGMYALPEALARLEMSEEERQEEGIFPLEQNAREIDLTSLVREMLVLEYPRYLQCVKDCRGLCPSCGANLNTESCDCRDESIDLRWSKLLELKKRK